MDSLLPLYECSSTCHYSSKPISLYLTAFVKENARKIRVCGIVTGQTNWKRRREIEIKRIWLGCSNMIDLYRGPSEVLRPSFSKKK